MREFDKMTASKLYDPSDKELAQIRTKTHQMCKFFNDSNEDETQKRETIIRQLLGNAGDNVWMEPNIKFDYGCNTYVGKNFYANFNFTVLDSSKVIIGDDCFIGPNVSLVTPMHSFLPSERNVKIRESVYKYEEYSLPITIGKNCWICTGVIVTGGVTIGDNCVIAAGSVVTRNIPSGVIAGGTPCKVIRKITEKDSIKDRRELW